MRSVRRGNHGVTMMFPDLEGLPYIFALAALGALLAGFELVRIIVWVAHHVAIV
jgi:hypothetical protein